MSCCQSKVLRNYFRSTSPVIDFGYIYQSTSIYSNNIFKTRKILLIDSQKNSYQSLNFNSAKKEMNHLNGILAYYIEKIKILEAQHSKIQIHLSHLRKNKKNQTFRIEKIYLKEIQGAKKILSEIELKKIENEAKIIKNKNELQSIQLEKAKLEIAYINNRRKILLFQDKLSKSESEISFLKRRLDDLKNEKKLLKQNTSLLTEKINSTSIFLKQEVSKRIDLEYSKFTLQQEIKLLELNHYQRLNETKNEILNQNYFKPYHYFQNYLVISLQQMREDYQKNKFFERKKFEKSFNLQIIKTNKNCEKNKFSFQKSDRLKHEIRTSNKKINLLKADNTLLEKKIIDLQDQLNQENRQSEVLISKKQEEIFRLKNILCEAKNEYEKFLISKNDLEKEIKMFEHLFEGKENCNIY